MRHLVNKLAIALMGVIVGLSVSASYGETITIDGSTTVEPVAQAFASYYMAKNPDVEVTISGSGSGNGAKSLVEGACDIGNMSRFMKQKEYEAAVKNEVMPVPHTVAIDGIIVVVNLRNPVKGLSLDEVKDIYTGKITNWKELGGPNEEIVKISRDSSSGTFGVFSDIALKGADIKDAEYVQSNGAVRARVRDTRGAIGYVGLAFLDGVKPIKLNDIEPSIETVGSGQYPLARPLFMWTDGMPKLDGHVMQYIMLSQSEDGREMIQDLGLVPFGG